MKMAIIFDPDGNYATDKITANGENKHYQLWV